MPIWSLPLNGPLHLTLAADHRISPTSYTNDQVWTIHPGGSEPPALAVQTTYGLRARLASFFPRFARLERNGVAIESPISDPAQFPHQPRLARFAPNYLAFNFSPLDDIWVACEYRLAEPQVLSGQIRLANQSILRQNIRLEWVGILSPLGDGQSMAPLPMDRSTVLQGGSGGLTPVCFMTGGPSASNGPFPALVHSFELFPGGEITFRWAVAAAAAVEESFEQARAAANGPWEAQVARVELLSRSETVQIQTGRPEWDAAFAFSQKQAHSLFFSPTAALPSASFVLSRRPDLGFASREDGQDHSSLWAGQTALESLHLSQVLLPAAPEWIAGLVENFLSVQAEDGAIDWKPGLGGQRARALSQPLIATLAWQVAPWKDDAWLTRVYPGLKKFFLRWFQTDSDRDGDGFPEWSSPLQCGLESHPLFDPWAPHSQGLDPTVAETPGLLAMLYKECQSLISIAQALRHKTDVNALLERQLRLQMLANECWDDATGAYLARDRDTHLSPAAALIQTFDQNGAFDLSFATYAYRRLLLSVTPRDERTRVLVVRLVGQGPDGPVEETITGQSFNWGPDRGVASAKRLYNRLERVEIQGLAEEDQLSLSVAGFHELDCAALLPWWAGMASASQAEALVALYEKQFDAPFGLPLYPQHPEAPLASPLWGALIAEALLDSGCTAACVNLFERVMAGIQISLQREHVFSQYVHPFTGAPLGERDHLAGLPPVRLFLRILGIHLLTPNEILIQGFNPYPWPVTVQYRKWSIVCRADETILTLPSGQTLTVTGPGTHRVHL